VVPLRHANVLNVVRAHALLSCRCTRHGARHLGRCMLA
jgi:hypothetical protein